MMMVVCLHRGSFIEPRHQHDGVRNKPAAERIHTYCQHGSCLYFTAAKVIAYYSLHMNTLSLLMRNDVTLLFSLKTVTFDEKEFKKFII